MRAKRPNREMSSKVNRRTMTFGSVFLPRGVLRTLTAAAANVCGSTAMPATHGCADTTRLTGSRYGAKSSSTPATTRVCTSAGAHRQRTPGDGTVPSLALRACVQAGRVEDTSTAHPALIHRFSEEDTTNAATIPRGGRDTPRTNPVDRKATIGL
jgi:hypothetical protein